VGISAAWVSLNRAAVIVQARIPTLGVIHLRRLGRYGATSIASTTVSQALLIALYGGLGINAAAAAVLANMAGTVVSYLLSRYWIWPSADRSRVARQVVLYWTVTVGGLVAAALAVHEVDVLAPAADGTRVLLASAVMLAVYGALWLLKFAVYQRLLFRGLR
jgi:putative flippase GtrA